MSKMMKIKINGEEQTFEAPLKVYDILEQEGYVEMMIAVAQNGRFVARDTYKSADVKDGDEIEIVAPMQGG
ncbi:MAG: sulfur carrier protein ThiS [Pseudomonadota bacterium]